MDGKSSTWGNYEAQLELGVSSERQLRMDTTRADERDQDCEVLFHVNKRSPDFAGGMDVKDGSCT